MNERARWRHRRLVLIGIASLATATAGWYGYQQFVQWATAYYGVRHVQISYTDLFDKKLPVSIEKWLEDKKETGELLSVERQVLAEQLLTAFPMVRKVSWGTYLPSYLHCTIVGVRPTFLINKCYVAGNNGRLYTKEDFADYDEAIPALHISKNWLNKSVFAGVHRFFADLSSHLLRTYHVYYHDPYSIALVPVSAKELPHQCVCLVDEQSASRVRTLSELMELCNDLKTRLKPKNKEPICFFDFRFKDRIISRIIPRSEFEQLQRVNG